MTVRIDESELVKLVRERGLADDAHARHAIVATLDALGAYVPQPERDAFGLALPPKLAHALAARRYRGAADAAAVEAAVMRIEHENRGFAREHVEIVCGALGELLPHEVLVRVERAVGPSIAAFFHRVDRDEGEPPPYKVSAAHHHTLAMGAPRVAHPIATSTPPAAQRESAGASNPHGDTKLSSARGETQEREEESLATAKPRTRRSIAESHD